MENTNKNEVFSYTYSAKQQEELKRIRQKYMPAEENKMDLLRKLDKETEKAGTIISITVGVVSSLLIGIGLTCTTVWTSYFIPGIIIGILGIVGVSLAYPLYTWVTKKQREKMAPQILKLIGELMHNN